jgi:plasmid rolling circle replication initiator protein Rep
MAVWALKQCGRNKEALSLAQCGGHFNIWAKLTGEYKLLPIHCGSPFCPDCAARRARQLIKKLKPLLGRKGRSYWHLSLTVPNVENLSKWDILQIQKLWTKLWESWVFQEVEDETGKPFRIFGAVRSIECTYNEELKSWHPHIHVIFEAPAKLPMWWLTLLKHAWNTICGDKRYSYLQPVYSVSKRGKLMRKRLTVKALKEVCKYATKCADFVEQPDLVDQFVRAFGGVRRIQCCGSFMGKKAAEANGQQGEGESRRADAPSNLSAEGFERMPFEVDVSHTFLSRDGTRLLFPSVRRKVRDHFESKYPPGETGVGDDGSEGFGDKGFAGNNPEKSWRQTRLFEAAA